MKNIFNKNKKERILGMIVSFFIIITTILFIHGFAQLLKNQNVSIITFYTVITIFMVYKLGDILMISLSDIFIKPRENKK